MAISTIRIMAPSFSFLLMRGYSTECYYTVARLTYSIDHRGSLMLPYTSGLLITSNQPVTGQGARARAMPLAMGWDARIFRRAGLCQKGA